MRCVLFVAAAVALTSASPSRAEDPPEGLIGIQVKIDEGKLVIYGTIEKSPAEKAGVKADDVLLKINDYKVKGKAEDEDLQAAIKEVGKYKPGVKIKLTVMRGEKEKVIEVTVGKRSEIIKDLLTSCHPTETSGACGFDHFYSRRTLSSQPALSGRLRGVSRTLLRSALTSASARPQRRVGRCGRH